MWLAGVLISGILSPWQVGQALTSPWCLSWIAVNVGMMLIYFNYYIWPKIDQRQTSGITKQFFYVQLLFYSTYASVGPISGLFNKEWSSAGLLVAGFLSGLFSLFSFGLPFLIKAQLTLEASVAEPYFAKIGSLSLPIRGKLGLSFSVLVASVAAMTGAIGVAQVTPQTSITVTKILLVMPVVIISSLISVYYLVQSLTETLEPLRKELNKADQQQVNLSIRLPVIATDETGEIAYYFNRLMERLGQVMERTRQSANRVDVYARELSGINESAIAAVNKTAVKTLKMSEFIVKINDFVESVMNTSEKAAAGLSNAKSISENFLAQTENNIAVMSRASESLDELGSTVEKIGDIINFVELVADQSHLLSKKIIGQSSGGTQTGDFRTLVSEIQHRAQSVSSAARGLAGLFKSVQVYTRQASNALKKDQETVLNGFNAARGTVQSLGLIIVELKNLSIVVKEGLDYIKLVSDDLLNIYSITEEQNVLLKRYTAAAEALNNVFGEMQEILANLKT